MIINKQIENWHMLNKICCDNYYDLLMEKVVDIEMKKINIETDVRLKKCHSTELQLTAQRKEDTTNLIKRNEATYVKKGTIF